MRHLVVDVSSAPLENAAEFIGDDIQAPSNYKSAEAIAKYVAEEKQNRIDKAGLDIDLARITGLGVWAEGAVVTIATDEDGERRLIAILAEFLKTPTRLVTFNGNSFDLPLVMRRARYLGVSFPTLNLDRFKSPHHDLCEILSDRNPQRKKSLRFYARRLGWSDISKTLSGAEEGRIFQHQRWADLTASLEHDVTATYRLAQWCGVIAPEMVAA